MERSGLNCHLDWHDMVWNGKSWERNWSGFEWIVVFGWFGSVRSGLSLRLAWHGMVR